MTKLLKTAEEWKQELTEQQYYILRENGTEAPYSGKYDKEFGDGTYLCAGCGTELFVSETKYDAGCGWPSFSAPFKGENVREHEDTSLGMNRTEVTCAKCGGHLGHVFPDEPTPTGKRYCINSTSLDLKKK